MAWGNRFDPLAGLAKKQTQPKQPKTVKVKSEDDKWNIYVEGGEWAKNGSFRFLICGAFYPDLDRLDRLYASSNIFHCNMRDNLQGVGRWLVVKPGKMEEFQNILPEVINYFQVQTTKYKAQSLGELPNGFNSALQDAPTLEEVKEQEAKVADNWKDIVTHLTADTSSKVLLKTQTTFIHDPKYSSAALSRANVIEILMVDPDATFYAGEWAWNNVFKRRIKPGSPYAIITKPSVPGQKAAHGEKWAMTKYNNITNNRAQSFFKIKAYDIRFTELIDPNDDPFTLLTNELSNNINPQLNQAYKDSLSSQSGVNMNDIVSDEPQYGLSHETSQQMFLKHIVNLCNTKGIQMNTNDTFENVVSKGVYDYAVEEAIRLNKLKDKDQQSFAAAVLVAVARSYNLDSPMIKNAVSKLQSTSSTSLENMAREMFPVYRKLVSFSRYVKEAVEDNIMSFDEFTAFVSSLGKTPSKVLDKFNDFSKRMDNVGKE